MIDLRRLAAICLLMVALTPARAQFTSAPGTSTLQSAATATGNGNALSVGAWSAAALQVVITTTATVTFEVTLDGSNWVAVRALNLNDGTYSTTATASGIYQVPTAGFAFLRVRVSAYTSGSITVSARPTQGLIARGSGGSPAISGTAAATEVAYWATASALAGSLTFTWDATNNRLALNRATPSSILHVDSESLTPASVATTPGTAAPALFRIGNTAVGGETTIATTGVGGAGSLVSLNTSAGGQASAAATSSTGGPGGTFTLTGGVGGAAAVAGTGTNTGGAGAAINLTSGIGGAATGNSSGTNTGGAGGAFNMNGGAGGAANTGSGTKAGGTGGAVNIVAGTGGVGTTGGTGGGVSIRGGTAGASTTPGAGGAVSLTGGTAAAVAGSAGGAASLVGGAGTSTGTGGVGGAVAITAGAAGGSGDNAGGVITLTPGAATGAGTGGDVNIAGSRAILTFTGPVTAPAGAADKTRLWSQDAAAGDNNLYAINEAGKNERLTGLATRVSTQFDSTNQTPANITGLTFNVEAGKVYSFEVTLFTTSDVGGGIQLEVSGTATATAIVAEVLITNAGLTTQGRAAALDSPVGVTAVTAAVVKIYGTITVNAAGTLTIQAARNAAVGTTSVLVGSYFRLIPQGG